MGFMWRLVVIALWPLAAAGAIIAVHWATPDLPATAAAGLGTLSSALCAVTAAYLVNFLIAWRYAGAWAITVARLLIWGVAAYLAVSQLVDLFGENWSIARQILGAAADDPALVARLRLEAILYGIALAMSATCIAIGFEPKDD